MIAYSKSLEVQVNKTNELPNIQESREKIISQPSSYVKQKKHLQPEHTIDVAFGMATLRMASNECRATKNLPL